MAYKIVKIGLFVLFFICIFLLPSKLVIASNINYEQVIFSELFWTGSNSSSSDEWIELKNTTNSNIDLSNWQITYLKNNQETLLIKIKDGIIPANGFFLISNNSQDAKFAGGESILVIDPDIIDSSLSLSNSHLLLKLYNSGLRDEDSLIDIAGDGGSPFKGDNSAKKSMQRVTPTLDGNTKLAWMDAIQVENIDIGSMEICNPQNSGKPIIKNVNISFDNIYLYEGEQKLLKITANVLNSGGLQNFDKVDVDLSSIGGLIIPLKDDGQNGDDFANDGFFKAKYDFILSDVDNFIGEKTIILRAISKSGLISYYNAKINIFQLSSDVILSEVMPYVTDDNLDEYIELYNRGDKNVNLFGWLVDDKVDSGSKPYKIINQIIIKPKSYLVLNKSQTKITLNDSGDYVRLIMPNNVEQAVLNYEPILQKDFSYNFVSDGWQESNKITESKENVVSNPQIKLVNNIVNVEFNTIKNSNVSNSSNNLSISKIGDVDLNKNEINTNITASIFLPDINNLTDKNNYDTIINKYLRKIKVFLNIILITVVFLILYIYKYVKKNHFKIR
jgi:hypothetical protein